MPTIVDSEGKTKYISPFYQSVNKFVRNELDKRAEHYGTRVRGGGDIAPTAIGWGYQKTAWATVKSKKHTDIILGTPGSNVMSNAKGELSLYNAERNVPNKPLLTKVEISNEGQLGSFYKSNIYFTVFPKMGKNGFDFGKLEDAFFVPGREVELKWGWSVVASSKTACNGSLDGIIYNFNWNFNSDTSVTATISIITAAGLAIGLSGDLSNKAAETMIIEDPAGRILFGSNLATVIEADLAQQTGSAAEFAAGQVQYFEPINDSSFGYYAIGLPIQDSVPIEQSADGAGGERIVKSFWYVELGAVAEFINHLLTQFDDPIKQIFLVQCYGNITHYNQNIVSAYPIDVYFPDEYMGQYSQIKPFAPPYNILTEFVDPGNINIGRILLGTDFVISTFKRFVAEQSGNTNIQYKNITKFFEEILKRINQSTGDSYQFTPVLFEPTQNNIKGSGVLSILSIEDTNIPKSITIEPFSFKSSIYKPLLRSVNISSQPPPQAATAAFVAARGNTKPEQTNVQVSRAKDRDIPTYDQEYKRSIEQAAILIFNGVYMGFSETWSEQLRGFLVKLRKSATTTDSHWLYKAIYPVDFSFTIDGINGFKFGDTLSTNMIPELYNSEYKMVFTVTKISHVIENKDWQTTVSTVARINGFADDAPSSNGSIHVVPSSYAQKPGLTSERLENPDESAR